MRPVLRTLSLSAAIAFGLTLAAACAGTTPAEPSELLLPEPQQQQVAAVCGEAACVPVTAAYISHFTGAGCTGTESYYTAYFGYDGIRRSWNGRGIVGTTLRTVTNRSYRMGSTCYDAWPGGNTLSDFVTVYRDAPSSSGVCGEASCTPVTASYISHFTGAGCSGTESYYTAYFFNDGIRRSWDGRGVAGTTLRTVTNRSYRDPSGACYDAWPNGNTIGGFVTIYREAPVGSSGGYCGEAFCVPVTGAYISHYTGSGCTGTESYYTPYFGYDGVRRSWDGKGIVGTTLRTVTNRSYRMGNACYDAWPEGNTLSDFVTVYRDPSSSPPPPPPPANDIVCGEASCVPVAGAYISHYTGAGCTGTESYFTAYFGYDGVRRSWDGRGIVGTTLRTVTNRSWRDEYGTCHDSWPEGNTLNDFVRVYR